MVENKLRMKKALFFPGGVAWAGYPWILIMAKGLSCQLTLLLHNSMWGFVHHVRGKVSITLVWHRPPKQICTEIHSRLQRFWSNLQNWKFHIAHLVSELFADPKPKESSALHMSDAVQSDAFGETFCSQAFDQPAARRVAFALKKTLKHDPLGRKKPLKINMETYNNDGFLKDDFPLQMGDFQVPAVHFPGFLLQMSGQSVKLKLRQCARAACLVGLGHLRKPCRNQLIQKQIISILLMEEILHQLTWQISHNVHGFIHQVVHDSFHHQYQYAGFTPPPTQQQSQMKLFWDPLLKR